jgi:DNA polymerase-3 subunit gamma/tau
MGHALYRKYRSKSLAEVVGQEHITATLQHALETGKISHAYLFTGPRGVGKTSIARILAHEINTLPYADDSMHLDIIEIDAASNRRIDEIRDLRDKVNIAPTSAKFKVYIIDEVHMLTKEAFNALLKTLEEPPAHVVFVLATTDAHKLPETIISRTQRFTFKPVSREKVIAHLRMIANEEKITITDEALDLIAAHGEGSFRDSISLLDQAGGHDGDVTLEIIQQLLGIPPVEAVRAVSDALVGREAAAVVRALNNLHEQGFQPQQIAKKLGEVWRSRILENKTASAEDFQLLQNLLNVPAKPNPERFLEIVLLEFALEPSQELTSSPETSGGERAASRDEKPNVQKQTPAPRHSRGGGNPVDNSPPKTATISASPKIETRKTGKVGLDQNANTIIKSGDQNLITEKSNPSPVTGNHLNNETWQQVLGELKVHYNTLYGIVRMGKPVFSEEKLELGFTFPFHYKRLKEVKNQTILSEIISKHTSQKVAIIPLIIEKEKAAALAPKPGIPASFEETISTVSTAAEPTLANINNIFGNSEVLNA